jgi:flagellum-specific peptidoglycan hydrolase FlgJ
MAQSMLETGHWESDIFLENHNLFGMKEARVRINTAEGTNRNHAYYENWRESVYDYAFYQCRYLSGIHTEAEYYRYLGLSYAESDDYVNSLKKVVEREKLKDYFK